jgi:2-phosphosulfolactate phosphatase
MTIDDQPGFDPRLAWASEGGALLARVCPVLVVVDILRFTTAVDVAVAQGARVVPAGWPVREVQAAPSTTSAGRSPASPAAPSLS